MKICLYCMCTIWMAPCIDLLKQMIVYSLTVKAGNTVGFIGVNIFV